jgi:hypothetical protein
MRAPKAWRGCAPRGVRGHGPTDSAESCVLPQEQELVGNLQCHEGAGPGGGGGGGGGGSRSEDTRTHMGRAAAREVHGVRRQDCGLRCSGRHAAAARACASPSFRSPTQARRTHHAEHRGKGADLEGFPGSLAVGHYAVAADGEAAQACGDRIVSLRPRPAQRGAGGKVGRTRRGRCARWRAWVAPGVAAGERGGPRAGRAAASVTRHMKNKTRVDACPFDPFLTAQNRATSRCSALSAPPPPPPPGFSARGATAARRGGGPAPRRGRRGGPRAAGATSAAGAPPLWARPRPEEAERRRLDAMV